ncbi:ComF family protein [Paenibacillus sp. H1-7]|nr:ComF family protein [Paenibacillus sp. H1-7]
MSGGSRFRQGWQRLVRITEGLLSASKSACTACGGRYSKHRELPLCDACLEAVPWILQVRCERCGRPDHCTDCLRRRDTFFVQNRSAVAYSPLMKEWLALFKYRGHEKLRQLIGTMLLHAYHLHRSGAEDMNEQPTFRELITYVPLSRERQLERGFNQAQQLAEELGKRAGIPVIPLLERTRHTDKQSFKTRGDRLEDLQGVFALIPASAIALKQLAAYSPIKLYMIDDVYTTGSTLNECAKTVRRELEGIHVYGISWAR